MPKRLKRLQCGRMVYMVCYTAPGRGDPVRARAEKRHASTAARERMNARTSVDKLERLAADNFDDGDLLFTGTFDDKHLPDDRDQTQRRVRSFLTKLRAARRARGQPLDYIYVLEGFCPGKRPHCHILLNSTGEDVEELRRLWIYGGDVDVRRLKFDREYTYRDLASYLTKEPREWGHPKVGERMWVPSLGLRRSEPVTEEVPDYLALSAPPEAVDVYFEPPVRNGWGEWSYLKYMLPRQTGGRRKRARRRKKE